MRLAGTKQFTSSVINYDLQCATHRDADDYSMKEGKGGEGEGRIGGSRETNPIIIWREEGLRQD
jgi:hypothetical protein